jgi:hypothetical protein
MNAICNEAYQRKTTKTRFQEGIGKISEDNFSKIVDGKNSECHLLLLSGWQSSAVKITK